MDTPTIVIIIILFVAFLFIISRFKKCPSDKVLVKYGMVGRNNDGTRRSVKFIHSGIAFIVPVFQSYEFLDLTPISFSVDLKNELDKRIDLRLDCKVVISTEPEVLQNAAERLLGLQISEIQEFAKTIILGELGASIEKIGIDEDFSYRRKLLEASLQNIEAWLKKIGLLLLDIRFTS